MPALGAGGREFKSLIRDHKLLLTILEDIMSLTMQNLESALAGESMAHVKYRYFAKIAREEGFEDVAKHFEETADQEIKHAWSHLELVIGRPSTQKCLDLAIEGETYEYTEMYPRFEKIATNEGNNLAADEARVQAAESKEHARQFRIVLAKAEKRFAALAKVEKRHAEAYQKVKDSL
jgi:rubrerythrin